MECGKQIPTSQLDTSVELQYVVAAVAVHFEHPKQNAHSSDTFTEIVADGDMCATHAAHSNTNVLLRRVKQHLLKK